MSPNRLTSRLVLTLAVFALCQLLLPPPSAAECLGCPAGSLHVRVYMKDGSSILGFIVIHGSHVQNVIDQGDLSGGAEPRKWPGTAESVWPDKKVKIWTSAITNRSTFHGEHLVATGDRESPHFESQGERSFSMDSGSLILIGEPHAIEFDKIRGIEDLSIPEGHYELLGTYYAPSSMKRWLLEEPLTSVRIDVRIEADGEGYYCFSFVERLDPMDLARRCMKGSQEGILSLHDLPST